MHFRFEAAKAFADSRIEPSSQCLSRTRTENSLGSSQKSCDSASQRNLQFCIRRTRLLSSNASSTCHTYRTNGETLCPAFDSPCQNRAFAKSTSMTPQANTAKLYFRAMMPNPCRGPPGMHSPPSLAAFSLLCSRSPHPISFPHQQTSWRRTVVWTVVVVGTAMLIRVSTSNDAQPLTAPAEVTPCKASKFLARSIPTKTISTDFPFRAT